MSLLGKTVLVTGSTDGIGQHTAKLLARDGANVLIHGRNKQRVDDAVKEVRGAAQGGEVQGYVYDLASLQEVRSFAEAVKRDHSELYSLVNNAGVFELQERKSQDGFEMTYAVNVLAPFLLTSLLWERITGRLVNVSSISADSSIDFDNLNQEKGFSTHDAYGLSKLCMMMQTFEQAPLLKPRGVTANCLDPGTVNTKMLLAGWGACGIRVENADDEYFLVTDELLKDTTGAYFVSKRQRRAPKIAYDEATRKRLWRIMEEQTGAKYPTH